MKRLAVPLGFGCAIALVACDEAVDPLKVGSKDFTEQLILGEMLAQIAENANIPVERSIPYGSTFENIEALKRGDLDVYAEYNGTGLVLLGQPPISDGDKAYARVEELYEPLGLIWGERLGFANDYELVMRADHAADLGIAKVSDLTKLEGGVRFGVDEEFLERPVDGFSALLRRYGLEAADTRVEDVSAEGKARLYQALLDNEVDVVEGFSTDGHIAEFGLTVLEDDLDFFPTYQPAPLVRQGARERFPQLGEALDQLGGKITTEQMREMNAAVELDGQDYRTVASRFLVDQGILKGAGEIAEVEELRVATGPLDARSVQTAQALTAIRKTFPGRSIELVRSDAAMQALVRGEARIALVGAEAFFSLTDGVFPEQDQPAQALGVVGYDMAHIISPRDSAVRSLRDVQSLGVGPANGGSDRTAHMILTSLGLGDQIERITADLPEGEDVLGQQVAALKNGDIDALFVMASSGHPEITQLMGEGDFRLVPLKEWQEGNNLIRFPFLRLARIPADTYDGQAQPVDTVSVQAVLAGPAATGDPIGAAGPGSAAIGERLPIADKDITTLNESLATEEQVDPTLPSPAVLRPQAKPAPASLNPSPAQSIVSFVVIGVLIYLLYLFFRKTPAQPRSRPTAGSSPSG